ncbi:MAG: YolD-like family protein [Firmicutes bacterium]|nr:YolD-like family protein [Bacillota bacterium]
MTDAYKDIIDLPRPVRLNRPRMPQINRAAQFAPFAALVGHEAAVNETARLTERRIELDEYLKAALNDKLLAVAERIKEHPRVEITYFCPDPKKEGGAYVTITGSAKKIDQYERVVVFMDGTAVPISEIIRLEIKS